VLHQQHGHALLAHFAQDVDDLLGLGVIEAGAGLVGEQQLCCPAAADVRSPPQAAEKPTCRKVCAGPSTEHDMAPDVRERTSADRAATAGIGQAARRVVT
jgi:hypothetical protein